MRRTILGLLVPLLTLALTAGPLWAEYVPGFNLYGHAAEANLIVLAEVDPEGTARVLEVLEGEAATGAILEVDRRLLLRSREGLHGRPDRAFLFLAGTRPVLDRAGIVWIERGKVFLLPDNWGWGIAWPEGYRAPTPEVFRQSVAVAVEDAREVARIAKLEGGRAAAASALLRKPRQGLDWYATDVDTLGTGSTRWMGHGYLHDLAVGLAEAHVPFHPKKRAAQQDRAVWGETIEKLEPGAARRAHLWILSWSALRPEDAPTLEAYFGSAADPWEREAAGSALLKADPARALALFERKLDPARPALANSLLRLLGDAAAAGTVSPPSMVEAAADFTPGFLRLPPSEKTVNLGYAIVHALAQTRRVEDLSLLLALALSKHTCRAQALVELRRLAQKDWKAEDGRWSEYLGTLAAVPTGK